MYSVSVAGLENVCTSIGVVRTYVVLRFHFYLFLTDVRVASAMICTCSAFRFPFFFSWGLFFRSRVTGACPVTTDFILVTPGTN